jgi:hypothetical protein
MRIRIEIDEKQLRELVTAHLRDQLGELAPKADEVRIEVKSKQNYKAEWEVASFRAVYEKADA